MKLRMWSTTERFSQEDRLFRRPSTALLIKHLMAQKEIIVAFPRSGLMFAAWR